MAEPQLSRSRLGCFYFITFLVAGLLFVAGAEILIRTLSPQPTLHPRWDFSRRYGFQNFDDRRMVHERPGRWRFVYTVNADGYRGPVIPVSNRYERRNIVTLGDSYTFGMGVQDGEEYPRVLAGELRGDYDVVNLGVGGSGLTQEIRRFYEIGRLYDPAVVILQFCVNDLEDNFVNQVTTVEHGRFVFRDSDNQLNWVKKYLSTSVIQNSQIYNLFRDRLYRFFTAQIAKRKLAQHEGSAQAPVAGATPDGGATAAEEDFYVGLLDPFARDLSRRGIRLIMISVDDHLPRVPLVQAKVRELHSNGALTYLEVMEWTKGLGEHYSTEGHTWDARAHREIGRGLARFIRDDRGVVDASNNDPPNLPLSASTAFCPCVLRSSRRAAAVASRRPADRREHVVELRAGL